MPIALLVSRNLFIKAHPQFIDDRYSMARTISSVATPETLSLLGGTPDDRDDD